LILGCRFMYREKLKKRNYQGNKIGDPEKLK
jgi:hypothetical protein